MSTVSQVTLEGPMITRLKVGQWSAAAALILTLFMCSIPAVQAAEFEPTPEEILAMARGQVGERWYGIYVLGKKVGWQRERWEERKEALCNASEFTLKLAFLGKVSTITSREETCYSLTPPYPMQSYKSTRDEDGRTVTIAGSRVEEELVYEITTDNRTRTSKVALDSDLLAYAVGWAGIARMKEGDVINSKNFDELTSKIRWQKFTLQGKEKRTLLGKQQLLYKIRILDETGMDLDTLVNQEGVILEGAMGPSIRIVLEDKKTALRKDLDLLDLYSTSFIAAKGEIDLARVTAVKHFKARLAGESALDLAANNRQKIIKREENSLTLEVDACAKPELDKSPDLKQFLVCNADIPCDAEDLVKLATQNVGSKPDSLDKALALATWVHRNFQYSLGSGGGTGAQILAAKKGDCTEYSKGLITLLRAVGIPARQLSGIVLASDTPPSFAYHAWVEVWVDGQGWVPVDPTWGYFPVDATHIVFDVDEGLQMAAHLGGLTLDILELTYDDAPEVKCD
jgi:hypothetical protein